MLYQANDAMSMDVVKLSRPQSEKDARVDYKMEVIRRALTLTQKEFGAFDIRATAPAMKRKRALDEMTSGGLINVYFAPPKPLWMKNTAVVRIPFRRGILSYRLLLINRIDVPTFSAVRSAEQLKKLDAGLQVGWSTTELLSSSGFGVVRAFSYDGLFFMLDSNRFDYIPRGVHEIYDEINSRKGELKNVIVEPNLALYIPTPTYTFVSKKHARLALRIEKGYRMMLRNGDFKRLFNKYYLDDIRKARLSQRRLIRVKNPYHSEVDVMTDPQMWFNPSELN